MCIIILGESKCNKVINKDIVIPNIVPIYEKKVKYSS